MVTWMPPPPRPAFAYHFAAFHMPARVARRCREIAYLKQMYEAIVAEYVPGLP